MLLVMVVALVFVVALDIAARVDVGGSNALGVGLALAACGVLWRPLMVLRTAVLSPGTHGEILKRIHYPMFGTYGQPMKISNSILGN